MKKLLLIVGAVVVIIIILLIVGISNLGPMIKNAVNTYGPRMTKTEVSLGNVSISIFSGEAKLKEFHLGNPKRFKSPYAMIVGSTYVDVDEGSLTGDTIIIEKIEVVRPEITYEKRGGTDNLKTILNNVKRTSTTDKPSEKQSGKESGDKKILIRNFIVRNGKVNLITSVLAGKSISISATLPDIHLKDVGKEKGGSSPAEAFKEVFAALYKKITSPDVTSVLNQELKAQGLDVGEVSDGAKKGMENVTSKVKGLFGN